MTTRSFALAAAAALALAAPLAAAAAPSRHVPGELLVKFKDGAAPLQRAAAFAARAHTAVADLDEGWTRVRVRAGETVEEALVAYAGDERVEYAQPNYVYRMSTTDTYFGYQWALRNDGQKLTVGVQPPGGLHDTNNPPPAKPAGAPRDDIDAERAWTLVTDCRSVVVAVLDTGVTYDHSDLVENMWTTASSQLGWNFEYGWDFVDHDPDPRDLNGHGTHVAMIIGANGNDDAGMTGVCWRSSIMAVRVLDATGTGTSASIVGGLNYAASHGAKVINMSLGGGGAYDQAYASAIANAQAAGAAIVVAAGNDGVNVDANGNATYPCSFAHAGILCVAALDQAFELADFSNYGATSVDVGAPGTNVFSGWAGTNHATIEHFATAGQRWSSTAPWGGGWFEDLSSPVAPTLIDPGSYWAEPPAVALDYNAGTDDRWWRTYDDPFGPADVMVLDIPQIAIDLAPTDSFRIACNASGGDPFGTGGRTVFAEQGVHTWGSAFPLGVEITPCDTGAPTVGFQLWSSPNSSRSWGVAMSPYAVTRLWINTTSYNVARGTSMASPVVAGIAAMLRAYHPRFTPDDVVAAISESGRAVPALAGATKTGKAAQAMAALRHVRKPSGLGFRER